MGHIFAMDDVSDRPTDLAYVCAHCVLACRQIEEVTSVPLQQPQAADRQFCACNRSLK